MRKFIYIVGWARGGTTLAKNLFACFKDTWVVPGTERDIFAEGPPADVKESNIALKLHFEGQNRESLFRIRERGGGKVLFLIRDPRDTVASNWNSNPEKRHSPFIESDSGRNLERNCVLVCETIDEIDPLLVRYEELCCQPDETQRRIADYFGLEIIHLFSRGNERYRSIAEDEHVAAMRGGYNKDPLRPIDTTSVGVWKKHAGRSRVEEFAKRPKVAEFIQRFYSEDWDS